MEISLCSHKLNISGHGKNLYLVLSCCHISIQSCCILIINSAPALSPGVAPFEAKDSPVPHGLSFAKDKHFHEISRCRRFSSNVPSLVHFRSASSPKRCHHPRRRSSCFGSCGLRRSGCKYPIPIAIANTHSNWSIARTIAFTHPNARYCKHREYSHVAHG
jgi:hypothetical protein